MTMPKLVLPTTLAVLALLAGCSTLPPDNAQLDAARSDYRIAQADATTRDRAAVELRAAGDALRRADEAWTRKDSVTEVDHWAYLTRQRVAIARETGLRRAGEQASKDALAGRDQVRLAARTEEADAAQRSAQSAQRDARVAQGDAQAAQRQSVASEQAAESARQQAQAAQRQTVDAQARTDELETQLRDMNARKTERGMVVTIGDVLFETNASQLRTDGLRSLDKLVEFMKRYPQRSALIEGFTDSVGSADHNQVLSGRRADAVQAAIVERGIDRARLGTRGYGESHPVAGNDSSSGRQLNRRVEIVLSDATGAAVMPR
jgi:outer membrane protein OmpA-like peptidoglycan-associated protein